MLNKALSGTYPAGSTFKTMVALAALEKGISPKVVHVCNKTWSFGGHTFHCDERHGRLDMHMAIARSCDVYFYETALAVGPDRIAATARKFGINQIFDIGIPGQHRGILPDTEWKRKTFASNPANQKWFAGETPSFGIGQGYLAVNPLQLCVMCARLANGERAVSPRLIKSVGGKERPAGSAAPGLPFDPAHIAFIRDAMAAAVEAGTARAAQLGLGPIKVAGKTGTAQARAFKEGQSHDTRHVAWALKEHGWFIAFAPADAPRYAMSVLVEHGGFGASAAIPKAREIMRTLLLKDPEIVRRMQAHARTPAEAHPANLLRDRARREKYRLDYRGELMADEAAGVDPLDPSRIVGGQQALTVLAEALADLPELTRKIFICHRLESISRGDIASAFRLSESAVDRRLAKAVAFLIARVRDA